MEAPTARRLALVGAAFILILTGALSLYLLGGRSAPGDKNRTIRVLAYSSFIASWGPGPEIAKLFEKKTGIRVEFQDGNDAGLLLKKLELFPSDVVIGFDQLSLPLAREARQWRALPTAGLMFAENEFLPFDWGPLAIAYRNTETVKPPQSLDDLLSPRFAKSLALEDPRTSSPGFQFLLWVLSQKGVDEGFKYLEKLKPSVHSVGSSWSTSYGLFQSGQAKLVLSYLTSPAYHWINDHDIRYQAAIFKEGHPVQVEYAAVPESCRECTFAIDFTRFLLEPEIQKILMTKNYMLPIKDGAEAGTVFEKIPKVKVLDPSATIELLKRRKELLERWEKLGM